MNRIGTPPYAHTSPSLTREIFLSTLGKSFEVVNYTRIDSQLSRRGVNVDLWWDLKLWPQVDATTWSEKLLHSFYGAHNMCLFLYFKYSYEEKYILISFQLDELCHLNGFEIWMVENWRPFERIVSALREKKLLSKTSCLICFKR